MIILKIKEVILTKVFIVSFMNGLSKLKGFIVEQKDVEKHEKGGKENVKELWSSHLTFKVEVCNFSL